MKDEKIEEIKDAIIVLANSIYKINKGEMEITENTSPLNILFLSKEKK